MTTYIFNEAGSIPGIPGTFANCRVDVHDDGSLMAWPLHSDFTPTITVSGVFAMETPPVEEAPTIVQEQGTSDLAPNIG